MPTAPLDDDVRAHLEALATDPPPPLGSVPLADVRASDRALYAAGPRTPVARTRDEVWAGPNGPVPVRIYHPRPTEVRPADVHDGDAPDAHPRVPDVPPGLVVLLHGGGFVFGDLETHDETARRTAAEAGVVVVSVDYRLAPEHPFPAGVEDAAFATTEAVARAPSLGADPARAVVAGDSAGGNLAAVVARRLRDAGGPPLAGQALVYPTTDLRPDGGWRSRETLATGYGLTQDAMTWFAAQYLRSETDAHHPDASPHLAPDLRDLPPAFVLTAAFDPLRDEGDAYADRLAAAGVPVEHVPLNGAIHGVWTNPARLASGERAWAHLARWMRRVAPAGASPTS
ncbi:MAG: alpha/beta hydrolase [Trueperaceae bacterium]|nr:alpha/beta hydrolase [Trueperaceae bacterium]